MTRSKTVLRRFLPKLEESLVGNGLKASGPKDRHKGLVVKWEEEVKEAKDDGAALVEAKHRSGSFALYVCIVALHFGVEFLPTKNCLPANLATL